MDIHEKIWIYMKKQVSIKFNKDRRCVEGVIYGLKTCANDVEEQGLSNAEIYSGVSLMVYEASHAIKNMRLAEAEIYKKLRI